MHTQLTIHDFQPPGKHPWGMLEGYVHAHEKEAFLAFCLKKALNIESFTTPFETICDESEMVELGFLHAYGTKRYTLTEKALNLLHKYYQA